MLNRANKVIPISKLVIQRNVASPQTKRMEEADNPRLRHEVLGDRDLINCTKVQGDRDLINCTRAYTKIQNRPPLPPQMHERYKSNGCTRKIQIY